MREITTRVFTFDELPLEVQDKIIEYWDSPNYAWWESVYEDAERVGVKIMEVDTYRGTISLNCDYPKDTANGILNQHGEGCDTYILAKSFLDKINPLVEKLERIEDIDYRRGYRKCLRVTQGSLEEDVEDLRSEFIYALGEEYLSLLRREYEQLTSRECIIETIEANECVFTENGEMVESILKSATIPKRIIPGVKKKDGLA